MTKANKEQITYDGNLITVSRYNSTWGIDEILAEIELSESELGKLIRAEIAVDATKGIGIEIQDSRMVEYYHRALSNKVNEATV